MAFMAAAPHSGVASWRMNASIARPQLDVSAIVASNQASFGNAVRQSDPAGNQQIHCPAFRENVPRFASTEIGPGSYHLFRQEEVL